MQIETLAQLFWHGVERYTRPDRFLQPRTGIFERVSTQDFMQMVRGVAQGLTAFGLKPGDRVALLCSNRLEWAVTDYAIQCIRGVLVPLYTSLAEPQIEFILKDCAAKVVIVEDRDQLEKILQIKDRLPSIKLVLLIAGIPPEGARAYSEVMELGKSFIGKTFHDRLMLVRPDDLATILYTSGTTGDPKGVMLSHRNLVSNVLASCDVIGIHSSDLVMSMLPLSHVFERMLDYAAFLNGASIVYPTRLEEVAQNMQAVQPTIMGAVPRFFEKFRERVMDQVHQSNGFKQAMFDWGLAVGRRCAKYRLEGSTPPLGLRFYYRLAKRLVLGKIHARTGGRVRMFISGGAALAKDLAEFLVSLGFLVVEGYGLTETSPVVTVNPPGRVKLGTVGKPLPGVEVKLAEDGEILVRGPNVMMGYYNRPDETAAVMEGGWFRTGDIGALDADGYLTITDRKKDLFKTSGGKYVAPSALENRLKECPFVAMPVVIGCNRRFPACLIVPNFERVERYAREHAISFQDGLELLDRKEIRNLFEKEIERVNQGVSQPEKIKKFALLKKEFSIAAGELTPTMKVRRAAVEERYREIIEALYREDA